jgi:hypothetical protein
MSLKSIIETSDFFEGAMFYYTENWKISNQSYDSNFFLENVSFICKWLENWFILPSSKLVVWWLALSNIKHYWNDFGSFEKLSVILLEKWYENNIIDLQVTKPKEDGKDYLKFANSTFSYSIKWEKRKLSKNTTKSSRSINMVSAYLHLWDKIIEYWNEYKLTGEVKTIDFNNIL